MVVGLVSLSKKPQASRAHYWHFRVGFLSCFSYIKSGLLDSKAAMLCFLVLLSETYLFHSLVL